MADDSNNNDKLPANLPAEIAKIANPVIDSLPKQNRAAVFRVFQQISRYHSGPLPDAETLREYAAIIPNGAERIMALVEKESAHRHEQEGAMVKCHTALSKRGQWIGLFLTSLLALIGYWLGINGHDWLAGVIFTTTIIAVVTVFVLGRVYTGGGDTDGDAPQAPSRPEKDKQQRR